VDFLLVLIELFSLHVTAEALRVHVGQNRWFHSSGCWLTQNFREKWLPPTNHSSSQKTRLNDLSCGIKIWTDLSSVFFTVHTFHVTPFLSLVHTGIPRRAEKNYMYCDISSI